MITITEKEYALPYYASGNDGECLRVWSTARLVDLAKNFPDELIPIDQIAELNENVWFLRDHDEPTCKLVALHAKRILEADATFPVILSASGSVMDGMHRVAKAWLMGLPTIRAKKFREDPSPDMILTHEEFRALCIQE